MLICFMLSDCSNKLVFIVIKLYTLDDLKIIKNTN